MLFKNLYRKIVPLAIRKKIFSCVFPYIAYEVKRKTNKVVVSGPFRGMKIDLDDIFLGIFLGTIELEIHPAFAKLSAFRFDQIINAGATEGYYAVGMALKWPEATVYAFETQEDIYRAKITKLASDNLVANRVHIRGYCSPPDLIDLLKPGKSTLLMLDVEGDEVKLLDPVAIDELRRTTILVELHDVFIPGCSRVIEERFQDTHNISKYIARPRTIKDCPLRGWSIINPLIGPFLVMAMWERSVVQEFFLMIPKSEKLRCFSSHKVIFAINSSIGERGQGTAVNQALIEFKQRGLLEKVYCSGKGKYVLDGLPLELLSLPNRLSYLLLRLPYLRNRKDIVTLISDIMFDNIISKKLDSDSSGLFIGVMGHCSDTIKRLKRHFGKKIILYCMNSHINNLFNILENEDKKFSERIKTHFVHKNMVKRVLEEYDYSDYIFVLSKYAYNTFIENGVKKDKLRIVWPGIDLTRFYPSDNKKDDIFRICYSGTLALRKGFQYLLKAIEELNLPDLELLLDGGSGDPVCHNILQYYKRRIKIEQWKGEHIEAYWRSNILIHPSLEDGWGLVVSEAMACGLPVVVTENTGAKDIIEEGINGFVIPPGDVEAIKKKIILFYNNWDLRDKMSQATLKKRNILDQYLTSKVFFDECLKLSK